MINDIYNMVAQIVGNDWPIMDPDAVLLCLQNSDINLSPDYLGAIQSLYSTTTPWEDPFVFENVIDAINNNKVIPETITTPPLEDVMYTVYEMINLNPKRGFSEEIAKYIAAIAMDEGIVYLPEPCAFANEYLPPDDMGLQEIIFNLFSNTQIMRVSLEKISQEESPLSIELTKILALLRKYDQKTNRH